MGRYGSHFWEENRLKIDIELELYSRALVEPKNEGPKGGLEAATLSGLSSTTGPEPTGEGLREG